MKPKTIKIAATAAVLVLAISGLMYTTLSEGTEYYKLVDEVANEPQAWHGKKLNLHGFVVEKSILRRPDTLEYRFQVQSNGKVDAGELHRASCPTRSRMDRGRAEGTLEHGRVQRRSQRRHRQVSVEVPRSRSSNRASRAPRSCQHLARSFSWRPSSPAPTRLPPRWREHAGVRRASSKAASAHSISLPR